ncbi:MAG: penicillin-binding protein 1C [Hyphomicrobiales bacterium]|nr:MAG: penicillin-binding protein 1C [Hyphomicrobiales bacterium]
MRAAHTESAAGPGRGPGLAPRLALLAAALLAAVLIISWELDRWLPPPLEAAAERSVLVLDRDHRLLRPFTIRTGRWRLPVRLKEVDPRFIRMLIAYEDRRFYSHFGVDPLALLRAAGQWLAHGRIVSGGSTLTMQLARLIEPRRGRSLAAKARQIARALQIEARLSKHEILEAYLNLAPYGGNLEGVRAAALAYFGKEPARLDVAEAALLTALPQAPEARRPGKNRMAASRARNRVLARMADLGVIPARDAIAAKQAALPQLRRDMPRLAAHLARDMVRRAPEKKRHVLSLDKHLQQSLERIARRHARKLGPRISVAILVADHRNGEVLARIGAADFKDTSRAGHVDMSRAIRSPGSALKPLIYGLGFEAGLAHPETLIDDAPLDFGGYAPQNFDQTYHGALTVRSALERSLNVPAVSMLDAVGPARFLARLGAVGIRTRLPTSAAPSLALALGGLGVDLEGLVRLYGALARLGTMPALRHSAGISAAPHAGQARLLPPEASWYVNDILSGTPPPHHGLHGKLAFKTGTSYGYRDAWAVGYDGHYVIGVWAGRPDGSAVPGLTGRKAAAPLLFESFALAAAGGYAPLPPAPKNILRVANADLPPTLRQFRHGRHATRLGATDRGRQLDIVYPPDQALIDLGLTRPGEAQPLIVKINGGTPPYNWFANGAPIARINHRRLLSWKPSGRGFSTLTVRDAAGNTDTVSLQLQ